MRKITIENYRIQKEYPRIVAAVAQVLARQRFVAPIDVFLCMGLLDADDLTKWKRGGTPYLERVIRCNLSRANAILRILRFHAHDLNLGPSITKYMHRKNVLQFSKTGEGPIEEAYARHFVVIVENRGQCAKIDRTPVVDLKRVSGARTRALMRVGLAAGLRVN